MKCNYGKVDNNINTWRKRYDHLNITTLKKLYEKKAANGLKLNDKETECISCIKAKHKRGSFNSQRTNRATRPGERLFTDICGSIEPISIHGDRYILTITDDYSRYTWVYTIKNRSNIHVYFIEISKQIFKHTGRFPEYIHSDNRIMNSQIIIILKLSAVNAVFNKNLHHYTHHKRMVFRVA